MANNVEIKARVRDWGGMLARVMQLSGAQGEVLHQEDTFFWCPRGRLKLRVTGTGNDGKGQGELIYYERPDATGPKLSTYRIWQTANAASLKEFLGASLGQRGVVRKRRRLYWIGQTRIHLDDVEGLGHYLEFEVVLRPEQTAEDGQAIAEALLAQLEVPAEDLVAGAYLDLLEARPDVPDHLG